MSKEQEQIKEIEELLGFFTTPYVSSILIDNIKRILEIKDEV